MTLPTSDNVREALRRLGEDLFALEVNTIVKEGMTAAKMPSSRRRALHDIARTYHQALEALTFTDEDLANDKERNEVTAELVGRSMREPTEFKYSGKESFKELRARADRAGRVLRRRGGDHRAEIAKMNLISEQSLGLIEVFRELRGRYPNDEQRWNNDFAPEEINELIRHGIRLDLAFHQLAKIRKAWDLGTEQVVAQTVISLDGDVTTRIAVENVAGITRDEVLGFHRQSVDLAATYWAKLATVLSKFASDLVKVFVGGSRDEGSSDT